MRSFLLAGALLASFSAAATAHEPWTGITFGANVGRMMGNVSVEDTTGGVTPGPFKYNTDGMTGGLSLGVNKQFGIIVVGAEIEGGYMDSRGTGIIPSSNPAAHQDLALSGGWYGMATGRVGVALLTQTLIYGKGGWAIWDAHGSQTTTNPGYVTNATKAFSGAVFGAGLEQGLGAGWSLKAEWVRFNFGSQGGDQTSVSDPPIGFVYENTHTLKVDSVRVGVNYKF